MIKKLNLHVKDAELQEFQEENYARISTVWDLLDRYKEYAKEIKHAGLLKYGYPSLDNYLRGIFPSDCVLVVSKTGGKKTGFARNLVKTNAEIIKDTGTIVVFSLELVEEDEFERYVPMVYEMDAEQILEAFMEEDQEVINAIETQLELYSNVITVTKTINIKDVPYYLALIRVKTGKPIKLAIFDYIQKILDDDHKNPVDRMAYIANTLKDINVMSKIPQIWISQTNRVDADTKGKDGTLRAKGSGDIENSAQIILTLDLPDLKAIDLSKGSPFGVHHGDILEYIRKNPQIEVHTLTIGKKKRRRRGVLRPTPIIVADGRTMSMYEYIPVPSVPDVGKVKELIEERNPNDPGF